jgi:hypothetical protein
MESSTATSKAIQIKGASKPFYISMTEAYHPLWRLQLNEPSSGLAALLPWKLPAGTIADTNHFKLNDFQNGWYIDPQAICQKSTACQRNSDGSYDIAMRIAFTPQRWFHAGGIVSVLTLITCITYLMYARRQTKHEGGKRFGPWRQK